METFYICYYNMIGVKEWGHTPTRSVAVVHVNSYSEAEKYFDFQLGGLTGNTKLALITTSILKKEQFERGQIN